MKEKRIEQMPLRVLYLEDSPRDVELVREMLMDGGYELNLDSTPKKDEFASFLRTSAYDIVLADFRVPHFDAFGALKMALEISPNVPFICVSGSIGEETAIDLIRKGAVDYVSKDQLVRLPSVVKRALEEVKEKELRLRAEETLRESEERYRLLFDSSMDGVLLTAPAGIIYSANRAACKMFQRTEDEICLVGQDGIIDSTDPRSTVALEELDISGKFFGELTLLRKDGSKFPAEISTVVFRNNRGEVRSSMIIRDITERVRAEDELRKLFIAVEQSPVSIFITDTEGKIEYVNSKFTEATGYTQREIFGRNPRVLKSGETNIETYKRFWDTIKSGKEWRGEFHNKRKNGELYWDSVRVSPIIDNNGTITNFLAIQEDITERKKMEKELQESELKYRKFFEEDLTADYIATPEGRILECNPAFMRIFGFNSAEEAKDETMTSLYPTVEQRAQMIRALKRSGKLEYYELDLVRKDGKRIHVVENVIGDYDESGELVQIKGYIFDDTNRKDLERQVIQSQKLESLGTLASGVAHDFNNILGIILGHASLIGALQGDPKKLDMSVDAIRKATNRGASLVKQLLTFARKTESIMQSVQINDVVREISRLLEEAFPKTIVVTMELTPDLPSVIADVTQIHQVLLNLCVNARDAMPKGGTLKLTTSYLEGEAVTSRFPSAPNGRFVFIRVSDTGMGMTQATKDRIFEPFFTTKDIDKGTGLGLALVHSIVINHSGYIDVDTEQGRGTTFNIILPVQISKREVEDVKEEELQEVAGGSETILIIEDEEKLVELMMQILEKKGYKVYTAMDGLEGIELFAHHRNEIAAIISDLGLPKLGGEDVFKKIHALNPAVKLAIASGYIDPSVKANLRRSGVTQFIEKPYLPQEILKTIRRLIDGTA